MWLNTSIKLYTPPTYTYSGSSTVTYKSYLPNTVYPVSEPLLETKYLMRFTFSPTTEFVYKDLGVNTVIEGVGSLSNPEYIQDSIVNIVSGDFFSFNYSLYQSSTPDTLYVNTNDVDLFVHIAYEVRNITTLKNISMFLVPSELVDIYVQTNPASPKQKVTSSFLLNNFDLKTESVVTFVYKYKLYDTLTKKSLPILNYSSALDVLSMSIFEHTLIDYDDYELMTRSGYQYRKMHSLDALDEVIDNKTHRGFIVNSEFIALIDI